LIERTADLSNLTNNTLIYNWCTKLYVSFCYRLRSEIDCIHHYEG